MATKKNSASNEHPALKAVRDSGTGKVKVACSDIDGVLRGKYLHKDKFFGAAQAHPNGGFGFCDVVFGWDSSDVCYDNTTLTGWQLYEVAILFSEALEAADRAILFKTGAKEIGSRFGVMPSFMAKWSQKYPGCSGHIHQSLSDGKTNLFFDAKSPRRMSKLFESYLAGQVAHLMEFAPMFWPTINSYKRLVDGFWAPVKPTWGMDNRTASFRVIAGSPKATRLETRCPGADVNPYLAMAATLAAGLDGVEKGMKLTAPPITGTNEGAENIPRAPRTLIETTRNFKQSDTARDWLGDDFVDHFAATRDWEWRQWLDGVTDWELKRYFEII